MENILKSRRQILALAAVVILILGLAVGIYLVQRQQTLRSRASVRAGDWVNAFKITKNDGTVITCDTSTIVPTCATDTTELNVQLLDAAPLIP